MPLYGTTGFRCKHICYREPRQCFKFSDHELRTGTDLIDQLKTSYASRAFNLTRPWCVGGPEFPQQPRHRRRFPEVFADSAHVFDTMLACRCESRLCHACDLSLGLRGLPFATQVNQGVSMAITRAVRRSESVETSPGYIGEVVAHIYTLHCDGLYLVGLGRRVSVTGGISKISHIIGLSVVEKGSFTELSFCQAELPGPGKFG